jgi:hypothetical protein
VTIQTYYIYSEQIKFSESVFMTLEMSTMQQQQRNDRIIALVLIFLTLLGLAFRLYLAWRTNQTLPDTPARLTGDEPGYERFAYRLLNGHFLSGRVGHLYIPYF